MLGLLMKPHESGLIRMDRQDSPVAHALARRVTIQGPSRGRYETMWRAIRSWSWRLLLAGGLLFAVMGGDCESDSCDDIDDLGDWFGCVWDDIEDWF